MGAVFITIILFCRVVQHLCTKRSSCRIDSVSRFFRYGAFRHMLSGLLGLALILLAGNGFSCDPPSLAVSILSGTMLAASTGFSLAALKGGTVALTSLFGTGGILVPCIAGALLFGTPISAGQWIGMLLFFVAAWFLISSSSRIYQGFSVKTFGLLLGVMLSEGFTMLSQQLFALCVPDGDVSVFSFLSFGTAGALMLVMALFTWKRKEEGDGRAALTPELLFLGAVLSVVVFIINQLATLAAATVPPVILFTFINGGSTIIGAIVAAVFFKERLTPRSLLGIGLGILSLVIIKAF